MSQFDAFIALCSADQSFAAGVRVVIFEQPSILFVSYSIDRLKLNRSVQAIDLQVIDSATAMVSLESSFLGLSLLYVIKNIDFLSQNQQQILFKFLESYKGPHLVYLFLTRAVAESVSGIDEAKIFLPEAMECADFLMLQQFFFPQEKISPSFVAGLYAGRSLIALDIACLLMRYGAVVGRSQQEFFNDWCVSLVHDQTSLFLLSQYFFSKQVKPFLTLWKKCSDDYPSEFWIAYWSEQLWQAHFFVKLARQNKLVEAKKSASRLPFSFIQKDWRRYDFDYLTKAHDALYEVDYFMKQSVDDYALELWYFKFFFNTIA